MLIKLERLFFAGYLNVYIRLAWKDFESQSGSLSPLALVANLMAVLEFV